MNIIAFCNYCRKEILNPTLQEIGHDGKTWSYCKTCAKERLRIKKLYKEEVKK